jgi:hypothetical protein
VIGYSILLVRAEVGCARADARIARAAAVTHSGTASLHCTMHTVGHHIYVVLCLIYVASSWGYRWGSRLSSSLPACHRTITGTGNPSGRSNQLTIPFATPASTSSLSYVEFPLSTRANVFVGVGDSPIAGKGLFLRVENGPGATRTASTSLVLKRGDLVCRYANGRFVDEPEGDKTVAYVFTSLGLGVVFEGDDRVMSLSDAIDSIADKCTEDFGHCVWGHQLSLEDESKQVVIHPIAQNADDGSPYLHSFIPYDSQSEVPDDFLREDSIGMFANDLAYSPDIGSEAEYMARTATMNALQLVWVMTFDRRSRVLKPVMPALVVNKDIDLASFGSAPVEIGLTYSWRYWEAFRSTE